jgi:hypothetical protein
MDRAASFASSCNIELVLNRLPSTLDAAIAEALHVILLIVLPASLLNSTADIVLTLCWVTRYDPSILV